ncbi:MAG: hypothetical protein IKD45_02160, partial [Clostridia bacterium]|nr:hypothetical protein [Clostridia bacterium]
MANKYTALLNYMLRLANQESAKKGKEKPTTEDFMSVVFSVLTFYNPPMKLVPGGVRGVLGVREELDALLSKANARISDFDGARKSFERFDLEHPETRETREEALSIVLRYSEEIYQGNDFVSVVDVWDAILVYSCVSVKKIILGMKDESDEEPPLDMDKLWSSVFNAEGAGSLVDGGDSLGISDEPPLDDAGTSCDSDGADEPDNPTDGADEPDNPTDEPDNPTEDSGDGEDDDDDDDDD